MQNEMEVLDLKKSKFLIPVMMTLALGWSGLVSPSAYADNTAQSTTEVKSLSSIEHLRTLEISPTSVTLWETWYNPSNGYQRQDVHIYNQQNQTIKDEQTIDKPKEKPEKTLFETWVQDFKSEFWTEIDTVELNGKQVKRKKHISDEKDPSAYSIAYVDLSTGFPVKMEFYNDQDQVIRTLVYFFDHENESVEDIFNIEKEAK